MPRSDSRVVCRRVSWEEADGNLYQEVSAQPAQKVVSLGDLPPTSVSGKARKYLPKTWMSQLEDPASGPLSYLVRPDPNCQPWGLAGFGQALSDLLLMSTPAAKLPATLPPQPSHGFADHAERGYYVPQPQMLSDLRTDSYEFADERTDNSCGCCSFGRLCMRSCCMTVGLLVACCLLACAALASSPSLANRVMRSTFDCDLGYPDWLTKWTAATRDFCCEEYRQGCSISGDLAPCYRNYDTWQVSWSFDKKKFCCNALGRGCATRELERHPITATAISNFKSQQPSTAAAVSSTFEVPRPAATAAARSPLEPQQPSTVAALNAKLSSTFELPRPAATAAASSTLEPQRPSTTARASPRYDCTAKGHIGDEWSADKRLWCCKAEEVGCPGDPIITYKCEVGSNSSKVSWSRAKMLWCCKHEIKGSPYGCP